MAYLEKEIFVRKSRLPNAGKGLFTRIFIPKGTRIVEYKGEILTWKEAEAMADDRNGYVFYVFSNHVIDAWPTKQHVARYANDAKGLTRVKGLTTNAEYKVHKRRCYITAIKDIPANSEIFVEYGKEYWDAIRYNIRDEARQKRAREKKKLAKKAKKTKKATRKRPSK